MKKETNTSNTTSHSPEKRVDTAKRATLKTIGATTASVVATGAVAGNAPGGTAINKSSSATVAATDTQHLSINIQKNRQDLDDWVLIENMTEAPLVARSFEPRYVHYGNTVLDLNALLTRQQKGKEQLELWPNHAWTHSTRGATRAPHALRPVDSQRVVINSDTKSVQIAARVDKNGQVILTAVC